MGNNADAGRIHETLNKNDGFGVGTWAVLIDARPLRLNQDGDLLSYFTSADKEEEVASTSEGETSKNDDSSQDSHLVGFGATDGSLDDPKENVRRVRAT